MKLQVAIDRVSLAEAVTLASQLNGKVDIIEMGTSLIKDYGNEAIVKLRAALPDSQLLSDIKTIDEGEYEFNQGFKNGADILTVMGASSLDTIRLCEKVSKEYQKTMMIDLLEVGETKIEKLQEFKSAIFCLHHSIDKSDSWNVVETVSEFHAKFPEIQRLAIAGGIDLSQAEALKKQGLMEIIIVGSSITKAVDSIREAKKFMEVIA
ncbi:orotidine 5'-phosphate decarboxylase / HUMPS family protein [Vagococcus hydrophili]|uniref:3-hexulose-6-phosphate synthase n=1 Tax=Vagococcus hydrophili TaxID=2714947 RepID=A0A6G8ATU6_9ENTE|nr:orotidine 5'-phosphate decarboxylase / HUMPS family protein [Vagococcus hydrophili]QIL48343.1 3-hexulose-6-phosphate synthase [Vagococcus hydrophili]